MAVRSRIFGWHSFKGGSGRSLGLLNVGYELARRGHHVLCVDMDLESCGLGTILDVDLDKHKGTTDVLIEGNYPTLRRAVVHVGEINGWGCQFDLIASKYEAPEQLVRVRWRDETLDTFGQLLIDTYASSEGVDYVLIDSRGGISEQLALSLMLSRDGLLVFTRADRQSRLGTVHLLEQIRRLTPRQVPSLVVVNGVPEGMDGNAAVADMKARLKRGGFDNTPVRTTPFDPALLLVEDVVTRSRADGDPLRSAYIAVADWVERGECHDQ